MKTVLPCSLLILVTFATQFAVIAPARAQSDRFEIGLAVCVSGDCASDGDSAIKGAQIAADELNSLGGVLGKRIFFQIQDTEDAVSGAKAITAYRQLRLNSEIHFFIGPSWTPGGLALAPIIAKEPGIVITSPSLGVADFHKAAPNIFNMRGTDEVSTRALAKLAIEKGWRRAAIFSSQQPWESQQGAFFQEEFEKRGGRITAKVEPLPTITTLSGEALRIKSSEPEVIFFSSVVQLGIATRALKKLVGMVHNWPRSSMIRGSKMRRGHWRARW